MDLYVYYRVKPEAAMALQQKVRSMQAGLQAQYALRVDLKRRPEEKNNEQTWMEIYLGAPSDFIATLDAAAAAAGLAELTGARHSEIFVDLPPCA